jgi:hypothetical protein
MTADFLRRKSTEVTTFQNCWSRKMSSKSAVSSVLESTEIQNDFWETERDRKGVEEGGEERERDTQRDAQRQRDYVTLVKKTIY